MCTEHFPITTIILIEQSTIIKLYR